MKFNFRGTQTLICILVAGTLATACGKKAPANTAAKPGTETPADKPGPAKPSVAEQAAAAHNAESTNAQANAAAANNPAAAQNVAAAIPAAAPAPAADPAARKAAWDSVDWKDANVLKTLAKMPAGLPAPPDVTAPPADAQRTASGLASKVLSAGTGDKRPGGKDIVTCNYIGWQTDGKNFDSSYKHGEPIEFPLNRVIAGWTEGLQLMVTGEKRRFWIPEALAYGGRPGAPSGMLVFDVELISFKEAPKAPEAPADVAKAPADAPKTATGLASKVLKAGTGSTKPIATSVVEVHYTGWTTDGKMFDSSVVRGQTATFPLNRVIPGWTEGLQLMVVGEKRRLWIPEEMAYKGRPGAPQGMLVFDVELISIKQ